MKFSRAFSRYSLIFSVCLLGFFAASCVKMAVTPMPAYPTRHYDYTHSETTPESPPWTDPQDYPYVTIVTPANGSFVTPGTVAVTGTYAGPAATLTLNGQPLALNGTAFSGQINVASTDNVVAVKVTATTTAAGRVSSDLSTVFTGTGQSPAGTTVDGLALDLENSGLQAVGSLLAKLLGSIDLAPLVNSQLDPRKSGGLTASGSLLQGVSVLLQSTASGLEVGLAVQEIAIDFSLLGLPIDISIGDLSAQLVAGLTFDANHKATVTIVSSAVHIGSLGLSNPLLDEVVSYVVGVVIDAVVKLAVPGLLENLLNQLNLTITATGFTYSFLPSLAVATDRNFVLGLDSLLTVTDTSKWNADFQPAGYRSTPAAAPSFPAKTPRLNAAYGLAIDANANMVNQLLYGLCATDSLTFEITDPILTAELFSVLFFSFDSIPPATPLIVRFTPTVAPVAIGDPATKIMSLSLPAYTAQILVDRGAAGKFEALTFAVGLTAPLTLRTNSDGSFSLLLGELKLSLEVVHNEIGQKNVEQLGSLFRDLFETVLPSLLESLSTAKITIPVIDGLQISIADLAAFGPDYNDFGIFLELQ